VRSRAWWRINALAFRVVLSAAERALLWQAAVTGYRDLLALPSTRISAGQLPVRR